MRIVHWHKATDTRFPWARKDVADEIRAWMQEAEYGEALAAAGERVMPLLVSGPTRCGKTSTMIAIARHYGIPAFRMAMSSVVESYLGQTEKNIKAALEEAGAAPPALWIIDEMDGIFQRRTTDAQGASQARNTALAVALSTIETLPPQVMLAATTNEPDIIDPAMLARFTRVDFPRWDQLSSDERRKFAKSHGCELGWDSGSYAEVAQKARTVRIRKIIEDAKKGKA
jgi:AAA+ superfamily predicted ATPase